FLEELANGGQNLVTEDVSVLEETSDQANVLIINKPETDDIPVTVVRHRKRKLADRKIPSKNKKSLSADVYIQEQIIEKRKIGKRTEYLVKWEGFDSDDNTWEPQEHFLDKTLINEFNNLKK
ncbi:chromobox protein homolog 3-like, partial [Gigantopelta aegis]|uniref:chromobox protein homolog 3-like n=1 Tax=Gigantopelta aegis TaxID=1735272 RepID=UPI001B889FDB